MKIRIKKWTLVGTWKYDIDTEGCTICYNELEMPCSKCTTPEECIPGKITSQGKVQSCVPFALHHRLEG